MAEIELNFPQHLYDFATERAADEGITVEEYVLRVLAKGAKRQMEEWGYEQPDL